MQNLFAEYSLLIKLTSMKKLMVACLLTVQFLYAKKIAAQIVLPQMVRDSMVLQRDAEINIWGWASKDEKVTVLFDQKKYTTKATVNGKWRIVLSPMKAGGPYNMVISGKNKITLNNILIGDVWFCSGQSNMVHHMNIHDVTYANDIATANYPEIRQFLIH